MTTLEEAKMALQEAEQELAEAKINYEAAKTNYEFALRQSNRSKVSGFIDSLGDLFDGAGAVMTHMYDDAGNRYVSAVYPAATGNDVSVYRNGHVSVPVKKAVPSYVYLSPGRMPRFVSFNDHSPMYNSGSLDSYVKCTDITPITDIASACYRELTGRLDKFEELARRSIIKRILLAELDGSRIIFVEEEVEGYIELTIKSDAVDLTPYFCKIPVDLSKMFGVSTIDAVRMGEILAEERKRLGEIFEKELSRLSQWYDSVKDISPRLPCDPVITDKY
ncbi:MAG: hypothetical protein MJZ25_09245 [Fibrobacter sp.]|nr:hypothetical protein [Fibrobacter sp.]